MDERHRRATPSNERGHLRIEAHRTDIVYQHRPCIQGGSCDAGAVCIDGYQRPVALHDLSNHRYSTFLLHLGGDRHGSGAGRLSTHVDNIRTSGQHGFCMLDCLLWLQVQPTVREGIGRHIQNAHDVRTLLEVAYLVTQGELGRGVLLQLESLLQRCHEGLQDMLLLLPQTADQGGRTATEHIKRGRLSSRRAIPPEPWTLPGHPGYGKCG